MGRTNWGDRRRDLARGAAVTQNTLLPGELSTAKGIWSLENPAACSRKLSEKERRFQKSLKMKRMHSSALTLAGSFLARGFLQGRAPVSRTALGADLT